MVLGAVALIGLAGYAAFIAFALWLVSRGPH